MSRIKPLETLSVWLMLVDTLLTNLLGASFSMVSWSGLLINIIIKEMGSKVDCVACFCQHPVTTTSVHTHAYCYALFKSGTKTHP